ncbi:phage integrase N-terminal SAM-like domain-containing protein [Ottowia beijingensis]|uniref:Phage integrase N-terminal SAM-like domain-containing protein n=1 Tax=Ottowia beijingensis TaxID=1207057 RepID=A0A853IW27_9BURK|nr:phage integrase N-terminal SAM-like domain-containing protein [Ottowia beijingensis]
MRSAARYRHFALATEKAYAHWVRAYVRFHGLRHPREMGAPEVEAFLTHLAEVRQVSPSTHKQALAALLFLYREVLKMDLPWMAEVGRPRAVRRLPVVLTTDELQRTLAGLEGSPLLLAQLLYGTGMRVMEGLRLRVKDVDFDHGAIVVREAKGGKDRVVMLPVTLREPLRLHMARAHALWAQDRADGVPGWSCRMHWPPSTRAPGRAGHGSGCFRKPCCPPTRAAACVGATTAMPTPSGAS